jgi:hypothetical protein
MSVQHVQDAFFFDVPPERVLDLPVAVVVFAVSWSGPSIAMIGRVTPIVEECARTLDVRCPVVALDADAPHGVAVASALGVAALGWGETCWIARGVSIARADVLANDALLRAQTVQLMLRPRPERSDRPTIRARPR